MDEAPNTKTGEEKKVEKVGSEKVYKNKGKLKFGWNQKCSEKERLSSAPTHDDKKRRRLVDWKFDESEKWYLFK